LVAQVVLADLVHPIGGKRIDANVCIFQYADL